MVTGPSGSGKSTLAFDVIFAEGQRRFLETLTPYARQFLPTMPRPDVDAVTGVPPSIALEQRTARAGANSTVATVTEVAHYLRLLFAKIGTPHCPDHDEPIATASPTLDSGRGAQRALGLCADGAGGARAQGPVPGRLHGGGAGRHRAGAVRWRVGQHRRAAAPGAQQGAHHRPARRRGAPRRPPRRSRLFGARCPGAMAPSRRARRAGARSSSPPAALAPSAGCRCRSWIRAGSPSTPSRVAASGARATACWSRRSAAAAARRPRPSAKRGCAPSATARGSRRSRARCGCRASATTR